MTLCDLPSIQCRRCRVTVRGCDLDKPDRCIDTRCPLNAMVAAERQAQADRAAKEKAA
jgi:hypothetical protein